MVVEMFVFQCCFDRLKANIQPQDEKHQIENLVFKEGSFAVQCWENKGGFYKSSEIEVTKSAKNLNISNLSIANQSNMVVFKNNNKYYALWLVGTEDFYKIYDLSNNSVQSTNIIESVSEQKILTMITDIFDEQIIHIVKYFNHSLIYDSINCNDLLSKSNWALAGLFALF